MKEIKFRAWFDSKMWEVVQMGFNPNGSSSVTLYCNGGLLSKDDDNDVVFMQYTGLKDRNGKEIYEGDIVKFRIRNLIVGFYTAYSGYYFLENDATAGFLMYGPFYQRNSSECEVIGNIYENPELLEEDKNA